MAERLDLVREVAKKHRVLLDPEALEALESSEDLPEALERADEIDLPVLTAELVTGELDPEFLEGVKGEVYEVLERGRERERTEEGEREDREEVEVRAEQRSETPPAAEVDAEVEIVEEVKSVTADGSVEGFVQHFRDRLERLRPKIRGMFDEEWVDSLKELAMRVRKEEGVYCFAGVVTNLGGSERAHVMTLEDETGEIRVIVPKSKAPEAFEKVERDVAPGMVVGVKAFVKIQRGLVAFVGDKYGEIVLPGEGARKNRAPKVEDDIRVVFIGDTHVGSKRFREDLFERFIRWLNDPSDPVAGRVKYVLVTGDVVDGIGIYPGQRDELEIPDIDQQYERFARYLEEFPDWVEVVIIPGNHDAIRQALPQPSLRSSDPAQPLTELDGVHLPSNPALVRLHGELDVLMFHGQSLDDIILSRPDAEHDPNGVRRAAEACLRARHLVPMYGESVPIAPLPEDYLVVNKLPHVFAVGHTHIKALHHWRGCDVISTATFQEQTDFQRKVGIEPTVGRVIVYDPSEGGRDPSRRLTVVNLEETEPRG